jgi:hypothetical protein
MGRIEHTLLDEGRASSPADLRPSPAPPSTPPYHKKLQMFLSTTKRGGIPIKIPVWLLRRSGRDGGGVSQPDYDLLNLAFWPLTVVNEH